jgi:hypothetical protein
VPPHEVVVAEGRAAALGQRQGRSASPVTPGDSSLRGQALPAGRVSC